MSTMICGALSVNTLRFIAAMDAVNEQRATWLYRKPINEAVAVHMGEAEWLSSKPEPCCAPDEPEPCRSCEFPGEMDDRYRGEHSSALLRIVFPDDDEETGPGPDDKLVSCPRCDGMGLRQFLVCGGVETETCTSCDGAGELDRATASVVSELMDRAHSESDPEAWDDDTRWTTTEPTGLADWLATEAEHYRHADVSPHGEWLARQIDELARVARLVDARDGQTYDDRLSTMAEHYS